MTPGVRRNRFVENLTSGGSGEMALERAFHELTTQLRRLRDALHAANITEVQDRPLKGETAVADAFGDHLADSIGLVDEALRHALAAQEAVGPRLDLDQARRTLSKGQEVFRTVERRYFIDLVSYDRLADLMQVARERGHEWKPWTESLKYELEQCRQPMEEVGASFIRCWEELAEILAVSLKLHPPSPKGERHARQSAKSLQSSPAEE